ncbi:MAG: DUF2007 domain-containing protein [Eubacteriales bacterium]|nr:DUF2007 domain-containing protein [Eubacteriales bacterium]MDD4541151.1 DUF2007 domain-containing protein [Eubacteriales bacterium]
MIDDAVLVFSGKHFEADLAKGLLESNQIPYVMRSEHGAGFVLRAGDILEQYYIFVNTEDRQRAEEILTVLQESE